MLTNYTNSAKNALRNLGEEGQTLNIHSASRDSEAVKHDRL
jgi:hypothetical protein